SPGSRPAKWWRCTTATRCSAAASPSDQTPYVSSRRCVLLISLSASRSRWLAETAATLHFVSARRVDVRTPPSSTARSPRIAPGPILEVGESGLLGELAGIVVDPVPGERARAGQVEARCAVDADIEAERRPHGRALQLHERGMADAPRGGDGRAPSRRLHEADRGRRDFRIALELGEADRLERRLLAEAHGRRAHHRAAGVAVVD